MSTEVLEKRFAAIGARVSVVGSGGDPSIDVRENRNGETFVISYPRERAEVEVVDVAARDRHLLLLVRHGGVKSKFLCGHDERHWFVAAVPEAARGVTDVAAAKLALQPELVRSSVDRARPRDPFRRRNDAYVRQGEWFFVPVSGLEPPAWLIRHHEPLSRGRGKSHWLELAYRTGGEVVWVNRSHPHGISGVRYARLSESERRSGSWSRLVRNPELYAKGAVRHPDHATVTLGDWHRVVMNTEQQAQAMRHVAFLD